MADLDYPLVGFKYHLKSRNFTDATTEVYASVVRRALRSIVPLTNEGLLRYAQDASHKSWSSVFRAAWRAFEKYASDAKAPVPALPRGRLRPLTLPAWAGALRALVTNHRLPIRALHEITWDDVHLGIAEGSVQWHEVGYVVPMPIILALREAATPPGGKLDLQSPLVPEAPGAAVSMSEWRIKQLVARARVVSSTP